jgi:hypothetical protein
MIIPIAKEIMAKGKVTFSGKEYMLTFEINNQIAKEFIKKLPITSIANNIGGEIYFRVPDVDLEYDGTQREEFEIGDIVYWRSPIGEKKFSIAMLYGNTQYSNWKSPRTSDPCIRIGHFMDIIYQFGDIYTGESITIKLDNG